MVMAQVWDSIALTWLTVPRSLGTLDWPRELFPQHVRRSTLSTAQVYPNPPVTRGRLGVIGVAVGVRVAVGVGSSVGVRVAVGVAVECNVV